jgi:hypothetical protein
MGVFSGWEAGVVIPACVAGKAGGGYGPPSGAVECGRANPARPGREQR